MALSNHAAERIKQSRNDGNPTQIEVADKLGFSRSYLSRRFKAFSHSDVEDLRDDFLARH
jgi:transcriptional regulator with XRE-family HTH domain